MGVLIRVPIAVIKHHGEEINLKSKEILPLKLIHSTEGSKGRASRPELEQRLSEAEAVGECCLPACSPLQTRVTSPGMVLPTIG